MVDLSAENLLVYLHLPDIKETILEGLGEGLGAEREPIEAVEERGEQGLIEASVGWMEA